MFQTNAPSVSARAIISPPSSSSNPRVSLTSGMGSSSLAFLSPPPLVMSASAAVSMSILCSSVAGTAVLEGAVVMSTSALPSAEGSELSFGLFQSEMRQRQILQNTFLRVASYVSTLCRSLVLPSSSGSWDSTVPHRVRGALAADIAATTNVNKRPTPCIPTFINNTSSQSLLHAHKVANTPGEQRSLKSG